MLPWPSASQSQSGLGGFAGPLGRPSSAEATGRHCRGLCPELGSLQHPSAASLATAPRGAAPGAGPVALGPRSQQPPRLACPRRLTPAPPSPRDPHPARPRAPMGAAGALSRPPAARCRRVPPPAALTRGLAGVDPVRVRQAGDGEDVGSQEEAS